MDDVAEKLYAAAIVLGSFAVYFGSAAWLVFDARQRGRSTCLSILLFFMFGPLALLVWLVIRPRRTVAEREELRSVSADEAVAFAAELEMTGDWAKAITAYEQAASQWPDQAEYCRNCVERIRAMQQDANPG